MLRLDIRPHWQLQRAPRDGEPAGPALDTNALITLLAAVQDHGAIAQAARTLGLSYRHAWGRIRDAERLFGHPLVIGGRGRGSTLSPLAEKLIWAERRVNARLSPLLASLASELEAEIVRTLPRPPKEAPGAAASLRLHASHGFAVAALLERLEAAALPVELRYRNSGESVVALAKGECDLAGFHVPIGEFEARAATHYRKWLRDDEHRLVHLAVRSQGLFFAAGNPLRIRSLRDLARDDVRFVNRPVGSGTRMLTELLLEAEGIQPGQLRGWDSAEFTHAAVAAFIASGMADAGIGVQTAAQRFGLGFLPLVKERYFLALPARAIDTPAMARVLKLLRSPGYRTAVAALAGYEAGQTGKLLTVREAFER